MKAAIETLIQAQKASEVFFNKSIKKAALKLEDFIVHKTQSEKRRALFGEDPLMRVN